MSKINFNKLNKLVGRQGTEQPKVSWKQQLSELDEKAVRLLKEQVEKDPAGYLDKRLKAKAVASRETAIKRAQNRIARLSPLPNQKTGKISYDVVYKHAGKRTFTRRLERKIVDGKVVDIYWTPRQNGTIEVIKLANESFFKKHPEAKIVWD